NDNTLCSILDRQSRLAGFKCTCVKTAEQVQSILNEQRMKFTENRSVLLVDTRIEKDSNPDEMKQILRTSPIPTACCSGLSIHIQNDTCPIDPAHPWKHQLVFDHLQMHFMQLINEISHPNMMNQQSSENFKPSKHGVYMS
ncbi:MAG: hypothetical protein ACF8OB_07185, partial [Phycisphaeraceae bacterium JB051]